MTSIFFTPYAWAKLTFMRDKGTTEVAGYGISNKDNLLLVEDFMLVPQTSTGATFEFEDEGLANYFDDMSEKGLDPVQYGRILIHTHPGSSASPSHVDETNFKEKFNDCNWAAMFILAKEGATTCALKFKNPAVRVELTTFISYSSEFKGTDWAEWEKEYERCVQEKKYTPKAYDYLGERGAIERYGYINRRGGNLPKKERNAFYSGYEDFEDYEAFGEYDYKRFDYAKQAQEPKDKSTVEKKIYPLKKKA